MCIYNMYYQTYRQTYIHFDFGGTTHKSPWCTTFCFDFSTSKAAQAHRRARTAVRLPCGELRPRGTKEPRHERRAQ